MANRLGTSEAGGLTGGGDQAMRAGPVGLCLLLTLVVPAGAPVHAMPGTGTDAGEVRRALSELAGRIATVTLDEHGKSQGDYDLAAARWTEYEPAWHTGQAVLALTRAFEVTGDERFLAAARRGGDWWVSLAISGHARLDGMVRAVHGAGIDAIVFATVSDGTPGLFRLYDVTRHEPYAAVPTRAGEWMRRHMYHEASGLFYDAVDPASGEVMTSSSPFWPDKRDQSITDVARPNSEGSLFKDMFEYTGDRGYRDLFLAQCERLVQAQGPEGLWMEFTPNDKRDGTVHPRFNLWYAESLLDGYDLTGDRRFLEAAARTARFYARAQEADGAFHYGFKIDGTGDRRSNSGSTSALAGIVWLRLDRARGTREFVDNVGRSLRWILTNRYPSTHPDPALAGGVMELRTIVKERRLRIVQRDIADAFAVRFLADWLNANEAARPELEP